MPSTRARTKPTLVPKQKPTETRRERFLRIGDSRMNRVLNSIRLLGNLANSNYECTTADVKRMADAISYAAGQMEAKFAKAGRTAPLEFHFADTDL